MTATTKDDSWFPLRGVLGTSAVVIVVVAIGWQARMVRQVRPPSPTGSDVAEIESEIERITGPHGRTRRLTSSFTPGDRWWVETQLSSPRGADLALDDTARVDAGFIKGLVRRSGRYRFDVESRGANGDVIIVVSRSSVKSKTNDVESGPEPETTMPLRLGVSPTGVLKLVTTSDEIIDDISARDRLFRDTGVFWPGPFTQPIRLHDVVPGPTALTFSTLALVRRLDVFDVDFVERRGGLFRDSDRDSSPISRDNDKHDAVTLRVLTASRFILGGPRWRGSGVVTYRGRLHAPTDAIHLASGKVVVRDVVRLRRDDGIEARADHVIVARQKASRNQ